MKNVILVSLSLLILWVSLSCTRSQEVDPCQSAIEISAGQGCLDSALGLPLTVSGYSQAEGWEWRVYVTEDTTSANLLNLQIRKGSSNKLYVPDSILNRYPMIIVQAATNCGNSSVESMYYSFVRRGSDNCTTWARKNL
jgi:hypothetical protein